MKSHLAKIIIVVCLIATFILSILAYHLYNSLQNPI